MGQFSWMYGAAWQQARADYLTRHPFCAICGKPLRGADAIVDHIRPHHGDWTLFWDESNWQALCKRCHDAHKQRQEHGGIIGGCDASGMPTDPMHPWNNEEEKNGTKR